MKKGCITIIVFAVLYYLIAYFFCRINPDVTYSWYSGIWHGIFWVPNLIMSLFSDSIYMKAHLCTIGYNVCYYATIIVVSIVGSIINNVMSEMNNK